MKTYQRKISMLGLNSVEIPVEIRKNIPWDSAWHIGSMTLLDYENSPHEKIRFTEFNCARFQLGKISDWCLLDDPITGSVNKTSQKPQLEISLCSKHCSINFIEFIRNLPCAKKNQNVWHPPENSFCLVVPDNCNNCLTTCFGYSRDIMSYWGGYLKKL